MNHSTFSSSSSKYRRAGPRAALSGVVSGVPCATSVLTWAASVARMSRWGLYFLLCASLFLYPRCSNLNMGFVVNLQLQSSKRCATGGAFGGPLSVLQYPFFSAVTSSHPFDAHFLSNPTTNRVYLSRGSNAHSYEPD